MKDKDTKEYIGKQSFFSFLIDCKFTFRFTEKGLISSKCGCGNCFPQILFSAECRQSMTLDALSMCLFFL